MQFNVSVHDLRADIPALRDATYLNFGTHGPSPRRVVAASRAVVEELEYTTSSVDRTETALGRYERIRTDIADFVGADSSEVALTDSTTTGVNRIVNAIDWEPGDTVVVTDLEHPSAMLPWRRLEGRGIDLRVVETERGQVDTERFAAAVEDARLAFFSAITWNRGTRLPVEELCAIATDTGTFTLVDAAQAPGQTPVDVHDWNVDALAAAGHKWTLGPHGSGFLYVQQDRAEDLVPGSIGGRSVESPAADEFEYADGARRFEIGSSSLGPHAGLEAALSLIRGIGVETIEARIRNLTDRLKTRIPNDRLLSPREFHSGIVAVDVEDLTATRNRLEERDIVVRALPEPAAVRVSIHGITREAEVDAVVDALEEEW